MRKTRELKIGLTAKEYCTLAHAAKEELRTVENEALYRLKAYDRRKNQSHSFSDDYILEVKVLDK